MNPFIRLTPLPLGACGARGFQNAQDARDNALNTVKVSSFVVLQSGQEFAWVAPEQTYTARALACLAAGVQAIEIVQRRGTK